MQALKNFMARMERWMVAASFAEAGCWDTARQVLDEGKPHSRQYSRPRVSVTNDRRPTLRM